ncbi:MAG: S8 family serine peptidase, partial [Myxococcales bacterium]|nr:S8 family serine peptidase [Myxococcales bacterium]
MRPTFSRVSRTLACALGLAGAASAANPEWPNGVNDDPRLEYPDDPSFINVDANGKVTGGEWNFWSFVPDEWADNKNFRQAEVALGTGIHADRAWQRTIGDRRVVVAVLDSGIEWDQPDLQMKHYLSRSELKGCLPAPLDVPPDDADAYDVNGDGIFNIADYLAKDPAFGPARDALGNQNGLLDPGDLIRTCSDGVDDDENGFTDDISGWDAYRGDNDPYDDTRYGHGTGEARDSVGAGNNGIGGLGVCPECTLLNVRVGDSFVVDVNEFATGVIFAVDSGASVVQEALGAVNNSAYAQAAIEYAYRNNVVIIASAADELSFHHNMPGTNNHTVYVHAIVHDDSDAKDSTTFLNFNNCTNFGAQLLLSTPGGGCSSEATGITSGHAGLVYSASLDKGVDPPLSSEEVRGLLIMSADDIDVPESATDDTKFPSGTGWDLHFGYGRNNARRSLDFIYDEVIPPEADIVAPLWFEPINVRERKTVDVTGRVGARIDGLPARYSDYTWTLEWALGVDPKGGWTAIKSGSGAVGGGTTPGLLATWDVEAASKAIDFTQKLVDPHQWTFTLRLRVEATSNGKPVKSEFRKAGHFISDPDLHEGWPKNLNTSAEGSPKVFDIDGDGPEEVIVATTDGYIHAFKIDGSEAAGFPIALPFRRDMDPAYAFNITDICAFRPEGEKGACGLAGHVDPTLPRQTLMLGIGVGALTGTETLSIVVATFDGFVYVYGTDGKLAEGWPQMIDQEWFRNTDPDHLKDDGYFGAPVLYDLDGNGDLEIIAAGMDAQLYVW